MDGYTPLFPFCLTIGGRTHGFNKTDQEDRVEQLGLLQQVDQLPLRLLWIRVEKFVRCVDMEHRTRSCGVCGVMELLVETNARIWSTAKDSRVIYM